MKVIINSLVSLRSSVSHSLLDYITHYLFLFFVFFFFLDLPADTPLTDLSKLADLDMKKLPDPEESGDRCIRKIQEFLIHEMSNTECGVLPEDKLQRLLVGVSTFTSLQTRLRT